MTIIRSTLEYTNGVVASNGGGNALQISIPTRRMELQPMAS
ncbi:MAG: hypothetical protein R3F11_22300 [Verrucomicrobiales bacterium]